MIVGFKDSKDALFYQEIDQYVNNKLQMYYKDTKSGLTKGRFVYCEVYFIDTETIEKEHYHPVTLVGAKYAANIVQAKDYVYSTYMSAGRSSPLLNMALRDVIAHWGHEFDEQEKNWPYLFGGWLPCLIDGLDHSIEWYDKSEDFLASCAYWAARESINKKITLSENGTMALARKHGLKLLSEPEDISLLVDLIPLFGTKRTLEHHYRRATRRASDSVNEYNKLLAKRKKAFVSYSTGKKDIPSVYVGYLDRHPGTWIPERLPGLVLAPVIRVVKKPEFGMSNINFETSIAYLRSLGVVDATSIGSGRVSTTRLRFLKWGISDDHPGNLLVPLGGCGAKQLKGHFKGISNLWERTGKTIQTYGDADPIIPMTEVWNYSNHCSLVDIIRVWDYCYDTLGTDQDKLAFVSSIVLEKAFKAEREESPSPVEHIDNSERPELRVFLAETVSALLASYAHRGGDTTNARLLFESSHGIIDLASGTHVTVEGYDGTTAFQEVGFDYEAPIGDDPDGGFFDVWDELGVS
jgi:hypothetical protein